ncbi:FAD1 [Candida pseudojiufengensis]|uniref:FAD1 n=1 Tax=Candida pseudojiufengensis TaxID=497109 RepID=UPI00222592AC|nr:FAD1 [Candida pseudojiufengensis]KAI5963554.1 FAD1 [Candida pseudojiufengensis]
MTSQDLTQQQQGFFKRCEECYNLIQDFLNDSLKTDLVPKRHKGYKYDSNLRSSVKLKIKSSMEKLEKSIDLHGLKEIAISYNGGKDCLVMLILLMATIYKKFITNHETNFYSNDMIPKDYKLDSIFINSEISFPELIDFIKESTQYYYLNPIIIKDNLKSGFLNYLNNINKSIKSVIVGIRYSDPFGSNLKLEQITDHNWPKFLRIHPILDWKYIEIWDFLVGTNINYCKLYDVGYTSLGGINNTLPNPKLLITDSDHKNNENNDQNNNNDADENDDNEKKYLPAYMLRHDADALERLGRIKST